MSVVPGLIPAQLSAIEDPRPRCHRRMVSSFRRWRQRRRLVVLPLHRLLHVKHPQPEHPKGLCPGVPDVLRLVRRARLRAGHHPAVCHLYRDTRADPSAPDVKQQLAAVRMLFDRLITGQIAPYNPAAAVRGPKHIVKTGKTPALEGTEWRTLLDSIPIMTLRDLRDRPSAEGPPAGRSCCARKVASSTSCHTITPR
jgi:hypothetical protein